MPLDRSSIRAVSFDYGHVLGGLDLDEFADRIRMLSARFECAVPDVRRDALVASMPRAYAAHDEAIARGLGHEAGWRAMVGTFVRVACAMEPSVDERTVNRFLDALWAAQPIRNLWRFVPPAARAMLDALGAAGVPMVVTSNSEGRVAELLDEVGIAHYFTAVLDSGRLGIAKPDRRIFEAAARALGHDASRVVHVGDSETADVLGALEAGMRAVRYDGFVPGAAGRPSRADATATSHEDLMALLLNAAAR